MYKRMLIRHHDPHATFSCALLGHIPTSSPVNRASPAEAPLPRRPQGWKRPFEDPIALPDGRQLVTLKDAGTYITKLPKAEQTAREWQVAAIRQKSMRVRRVRKSLEKGSKRYQPRNSAWCLPIQNGSSSLIALKLAWTAPPIITIGHAQLRKSSDVRLFFLPVVRRAMRKGFERWCHNRRAHRSMIGEPPNGDKIFARTDVFIISG
jgi:hypothetical protein